jgi:hypothetical protein
MNYRQIEAELDRRLVAFNVEVSTEAKEIVIRAIGAIETDPNPDWRQPVPSGLVDRMQEDLIAAASLKLIGMYQNIYARRSSGRRVTTFDLLHVISKWIDDLCPFEKVRGTP